MHDQNIVDWKTFIAEIVKALAWPSAVIVVLLVFRESVSAILLKMNRLRYKELEAEFGKTIEQEKRKADEAGLPPATVEPERLPEPLLDSDYLLLRRIVEVGPRAAIMEAWAKLESALQAAAVRLGVETRDSTDRVTFAKLFDHIATLGEQGSALLSNIKALRKLRNEVVHEPLLVVSVSPARDYVRLALRVVNALDELQGQPVRT